MFVKVKVPTEVQAGGEAVTKCLKQVWILVLEFLASFTCDGGQRWRTTPEVSRQQHSTFSWQSYLQYQVFIKRQDEVLVSVS